jgi:acyl transferase domain-containing protein/phosphopantetheinyl transferase
MKRRTAYDIAIIGMGCRFPGAVDLCAFWANILANRDATREVPPDRWPLEAFYEPGSSANDRLASRRGGYLDTPIAFDAAAQGIMPHTVAGGEPEQFLVLSAARDALADASIVPHQLGGQNVEVVIGRGNYFNRGNLLRLQHGRIVAQTVGLLAALHPEWTHEDLERLRRDLKSSLPPFEAATIPGQLTNATAGRIAERLDLHGAAFVVDAASASSLVALELGSRALLEHRADLALVGGVYVEADVDFPLVFRQLGVLSPSGAARPFSAGADGMVPGEGVGVVVLKRLADAERDGDRVYAVLKGIGLSSDGRGRGLASPSRKGHLRAIRRACRAARVAPETVGLIEGHGLGISASDRAEIIALKHAYPPARHAPRVLGAVSSQIGHAMPAAGMAGLIKTALALHHRVLPPTRGAEQPLSTLTASGFELLETPRPWIHGNEDAPRRAGVNAFGFAGINAHAVLEEHATSADSITPGGLRDWDTEALLLAADDRAALADRVRWLRDRLRSVGPCSLKDLAFTLNTEPDALSRPVRLGIVATSVEELTERLGTMEPRLRDRACRQVRDARGLYFWEEPPGRTGSLAFLFPGEGSQYPGMLADLCSPFPELRRVLDTADRIARGAGEDMLPSQHLFGGGTATGQGVWAAGTAVTAVFSSQWALFQVLTRLGLKPDAVCGQSSGELSALAAAGVIRTDSSLERSLISMASIFRELESTGAIPGARLVAIGTDRDRVTAACRDTRSSAEIILDNCPHQVVIAGPGDEVEKVVTHLRASGVLCEELPFSRAYHTPAFSAVLEPLIAFYESLELEPARCPVYSCATAAPMPHAIDEIRRLAVDQWTRRVAFRDTVEAMYRDGARVFVDVGTRGNLSGYVEDVLRGRSFFAMAANVPRRSGTAQLNHLVAALFAQGLALDPAYLYARRRPERIDLDATPAPVRPVTQLMLGFPEMTLSQATIEHLRRRSQPDAETHFDLAAEILQDETPASGEADSLPCRQGNGRFSGREPGELADLLPLPISDQSSSTSSSWLHGVEADDHDEAMLGYLETMNAFLSAQREIMQAFLARPADEAVAMATDLLPRELARTTRSSASPGPWAGVVCACEPGRKIVTQLSLDPSDDPVAEHHTLGGRRVSALDPSLRGLAVIPFSVMAEMVAQVAALLVPSGLVLERLEDVHAHRWVPYSRSGVLEMHGETEPSDPRSVRVSLYHRPGDAREAEAVRLVYEGIARFSDHPPESPPASPFSLESPRASRFTAERLYEEQWLFHGPPMQALTEVGPVSPDGISGTIVVRPLDPLLGPGASPVFHTDPIALDTFTHLLGCWGLDCLDHGDVIFPLRMGRLSIHGEPPGPGTPLACRIRVCELQRHRVTVDAELVRPDGRVWMRIERWQDWRFYWPARYRDVFRAPDTILIGESLSLEGVAADEAVAVWLAPPGDMARPVWRDVLEQTQLGPQERALCLSRGGTELGRTHRLWGRIAAKEAARRLWLAQSLSARFPADLAIETDQQGRPFLQDLARPGAADLPRISIAHADGLVVALASREERRQVGIDVEAIDVPPDATKDTRFPEEDQWLERACAEVSWPEWRARLRAARQAAAKAIGMGPRRADDAIRIVRIDVDRGEVIVAQRTVESASDHVQIRVHTSRREEYVWAWTLGEEADLHG